VAQAFSELDLVDQAPAHSQLLEEILEGLSAPKKTLPCKYFYDERGSALFDRICELDEYYPTRTELSIMQHHGPEMSAALGTGCRLIEYGSGSSLKTRILLDHLEEPAGYVPVDISREHLMRSAEAISQRHPELEVLPVCADFSQPFDLPVPKEGADHTAAYFPGSTIGNFARTEARALLVQIAEQCGSGGGLLIGVDLRKPREVLEAAYNDAEGVTADFNLNLLRRLNRELGADFQLDAFEHRAHWDPDLGRVEMHLVSRERQVVHIDGERIEFDRGETIHTENSHKYGLEEFATLASEADFTVARVWTDEAGLFSVQHLRLP
jgi:dimethylhistidine N-methyltransferase